MDHDVLISVISAVPLPLVVIAQDETVIALNPRAEDLFGRGLTGRNYVTVLRQPALLDTIENALGSGQTHETRYFGSEAGRDTTFAVRCSPITYAGQPAVIVTLEDTTHLEELGQMRRDFVANVSHELKTPLTALLGFIETLRGAARNDEKARDRFLGIMEREATRMNRLVRDLLSLSRVEGEERMRPNERIDLAAIVGSAVDTLRPLAEENGGKIEFTLDNAPIWVQGDPDQLMQVLTNLIDNAIKYGRNDQTIHVDLTTSTRDPSLRGPAVKLQVQDQGEGIDPLHIPRLTERFYRVDNHRSREMGGTGLGLAIVKHIVSRHRGRMRVDSEQGVGTCFTVLLPIDQGPITRAGASFS
ncbi:sensor histidine kinase [Parasulfitobacter algicola]|uniref:histidine kinase n=1 Tax=Parasulfitobacter algicola TaxID=2614809 RepID=A0ABX2IXQ9_9RHOB|nr:ATP-binding protein [Sulfitobacter algicola]NSX55314.1 two-component sensor histidine kinase [Sulfitobacter algicola]